MATATRAHHLPPETIGNVISFLPQADLKNLRLVDHRFSTLATRRLFRRTRLLARAKDNNDPQRFIQLANSEFSGFVREVSCDVSSIVHNGFYYMEKYQFEFLPVFWDALPLLGHFRNMQTLHLCFDANSTPQVHEAGSTEFRKRVMKTIFRILTGTLTTEVSNTTQDALSSASTEISSSSTPDPITQEGSWTDVNESSVTIVTGGETEMTSLWWHQIIWQIRNSMLNLKRFCVSRLPGTRHAYPQFLRMIRSNPSFRGYETFRDEHIHEYMDSWSKFEAFNKHVCRPWNEAFQHYTYITPIELSLESDVSRPCFSGLAAKFIMCYSVIDYVSQDTTDLEQTSYERAPVDEEADPELGNRNNWARIQVFILNCMLSKRSQKQHVLAEELRLVPMMGPHSTMEYMERVLRPLLTHDELLFLKSISS
ncbi:hypothetical protein FMEXI_654 [Fusarium mexicanum]|uniref:F-box domain-containing protein n=1 Tax=Fusarium mexicanum TaxID=751941 RepID=A0A8H5JLK1_9HYPO|nr:hypothetical protein FMEXI_654 [Fusarium mexicanum]